jgi:hypothetical protein
VLIPNVATFDLKTFGGGRLWLLELLILEKSLSLIIFIGSKSILVLLLAFNLTGLTMRSIVAWIKNGDIWLKNF